MICNLCPRRCNAHRTDTENIGGFCKMPMLPTLAKATLHFGEEPCISGKNGSGTVFFSGCSLSCIYCQNYNLSHNSFGKGISIERLAEIFKELEQSGANNINLVTPSHYSHAIIKALDIYRPNIPIVYNCSGYENLETLEILEKYVDIYLIDFKYLSSQKARLLSNAPDYPEIAKAALKEVYRQKGNCIFDNNGILKNGVIVRHLLLPQSTNDAIGIFNFVRENMPNAYFSLMSQYVPMHKAETVPQINRRITKREYEKVVNYILDSGFSNCYFQELDSATKEYIPDFDLSGV